MKAKKRSWGYDRKKIVPVRFSEEEKRQVQAGAQASGLSLSAFIRETALHSAAVGTCAVESTFERTLRHRLRRAHTVLQRAQLHTGTEAGAEHLRQAASLLHDAITQLRPRGGSSI
ncbi:MAG: hypothetical protein ACE5G0_17150 [Rhodothermales bacterium]